MNLSMATSAQKKPRVQPSGRAVKWVRLPHQARSQDKLERFVAAAEKLIAKKGFQATTIPDIAKEAGCSVGLFYTRFEDKEDLLRYLMEHYLGETLATAKLVLESDAIKGASVADFIRLAVRGLVQIHREREGLVYAFYENVQKDPVLGKRVVEIQAEIEELLYRAVEARKSEIGHPDLRAAISFGNRLAIGVLQQRSLAGRIVSESARMPYETIEKELTRTLLAYLGIKQP